MATTSNVTNANTIPVDTSSKNRTPSSELGKDEFLQILAVQLSNQDPLEPSSDTEFIAQMAQFTSLEQMQAMAAATESSQAYELIGKDVMATVTDSSGSQEQIIGRVTSVRRSGGTEYLVMGSYLVPLKSVGQVYDSGLANDSLFSQAAAYVGKTIEGEIPTDRKDDEGNMIYDTVKGDVEYLVKKEDGLLYVKLKDTEDYQDKEVMVNYITKVY